MAHLFAGEGGRNLHTTSQPSLRFQKTVRGKQTHKQNEQPRFVYCLTACLLLMGDSPSPASSKQKHQHRFRPGTRM